MQAGKTLDSGGQASINGMEAGEVVATAGEETMIRISGTCIAAVFGLTAFASPAAAIINGGFESGVLGPSWLTTGNVEVVSQPDFTPAVPAPGGAFFALLSTNPGGAGVPSPFDLDLANGNEFDVSIIEQTFVTPLSGTLSFDVSMLTSEPETNFAFVDIAACDVDGFFVYEGASANVLAGSLYQGLLTGFPHWSPAAGLRTARYSPGGFPLF